MGRSARQREATAAPGPSGELDIVYEDDALLVVSKPPGILSVPLERSPEVPSVYRQIEERLRSHGKRRPFVVHRIDQDTSGLVVFAKDPTSQQRLKAQFARREPERVYLAVVYGHPSPPEGTWRDMLVWDTKALIQKETHRRDPRGTEAIAEYRVVESFRGRVAHRGAPAHRQAEPDPAAVATARAHARRRAALRLWTGCAAADYVRPPGAPRLPPGVRASPGRTRAELEAPPPSDFQELLDAAPACQGLNGATHWAVACSRAFRV